MEYCTNIHIFMCQIFVNIWLATLVCGYCIRYCYNNLDGFMNKTLLVSSLIACLSIASVNVYAEGESSISIGYAQSRVKEDGYKLDKKSKRFQPEVSL